MTKDKAADKIIEEIIGDISTRSSIGNAWEEIDKDIQDEIKATWKSQILRILRSVE